MSIGQYCWSSTHAKDVAFEAVLLVDVARCFLLVFVVLVVEDDERSNPPVSSFCSLWARLCATMSILSCLISGLSLWKVMFP